MYRTLINFSDIILLFKFSAQPFITLKSLVYFQSDIQLLSIDQVILWLLPFMINYPDKHILDL